MKKKDWENDIIEKYNNIKTPIYIYGAGIYGAELYELLNHYNLFGGFIDNNEKIILSGYKSENVISEDDFFFNNLMNAIVIAASEKNTNIIKNSLIQRGLVYNKDFFIYDEFLQKVFPIIALKKYRQSFVNLSQICLTEKCTLKCKKCAHACYAVKKDKEDLTFQQVKNTADVFFSKVDYIQEFVLIGGEPLLYEKLPQVIEYIGSKYRNQMKNKQLLCVLFPLLVACTGQRHQQQVSSESIIEEAVRKGEVLKGEIVPIDTALFRYAYRMRVQGDKAVILDLHNADYYYHVFTYPDFQYQSSFGKRGEGPGESIYAANIRFAGQDTVWVLDDGKGRMYQYSGIAGGKTPKQEKDILLDKRLFRSLDFDLKDASTVVIPDYSGENRFSWASLSSGELLRKSEQIPVSDPELLRESAPAVAQGWNSFVSFSPDKKILVSVTQFGDRLDIYSMASQKHIGELGGDGEPQFKVSPEGYGLPAGRICYYDVQVTDQYIYTIYDGRKFKDIMKLADAYKQGGRILRIFTHEGNVVKTLVLDRPIAGIYVDEAAGMLFGLDVNADEQIVKFPLELE